MAGTHLTDAAVERFRRPRQGRTEVSDSQPGLFLWITPNGTKSWAVIYRLPSASGKRTDRRKKVVGQHPQIGVAAARDAARRIMSQAAQGLDPDAVAADERALTQQAKEQQLAGTFRAIANEWVVAMQAGRLIGGRRWSVTADTAAGRKSLLERKVLPSLGDKVLSEVTPSMVHRLLTAIEAESGPADNTLKVIRGVFRFAASRGLFSGQHPTAGMTKRQAAMKETRALSDEDLKVIWAAAGRVGWPYGAMMRALMLTGQRRKEIAGLRWDEIDFDRKLLIIPQERVKNRAGAHEVPITASLAAILRGAGANRSALNDQRVLVFPSTITGHQLAGWNKLKKLFDREICAELAGLSADERRALRAGGALRPETRVLKAQAEAQLACASFAPWRIHDLRHTFITRCRDGEENADGEIVWSAPLDVLQATVNHEITAGVTAAYDHGDFQRRYRLRKRELLEWWAGKLLQIVADAS